MVNYRMGKIQLSVEHTSGSFSQGTAGGQQGVPELQRAKERIGGALGKLLWGRETENLGSSPCSGPLASSQGPRRQRL